MHSQKAFTLMEILVAITLSLIVITGLSHFFTTIYSGISEIHTKAFAFLDIENFEADIQTAKQEFPNILIQESISTQTSGFDILVFTDIGETTGKIFGAYNRQNDTIAYTGIANAPNYWEIHLFSKDLSNTEIASYKSDINNFITSFSTTNISYFSNIYTHKFGVAEISPTGQLKIDLGFTTRLEEAFIGQTRAVFLQDSLLKKYFLSLLF